MRDILHMMRFDYLTAKPIALTGAIFAVGLSTVLCLLFSPIIAAYFSLAAMIFVIPLQGAADKNGFHKLYGILPVERRSITRARFLYIYLVHFIMQMLGLLVACISKALQLYRFLPNQDSETMLMVKNSFADTKLMLLMVFGVGLVFCLLFSFMEMMGQIFGRENEFKILLIVVGILALLAFVFSLLTDRDLIPVMQLPHLPEKVPAQLALGLGADVLMLGLCILFGEITASRLARREL